MATTGTRAALIAGWALVAGAPVLAQQRIAPSDVVIANESMEVQVAYNSFHNEFLAVWGTDTYPHWIRGMRLRHDGRPASGAFDISPTEGNDRGQPAVAYDRVHDYYLVTYTYDYSGDSSDTDIHCVFLSWNGVPLTSDQVVADTNEREQHPQLAFSAVSEKWLVIWEEALASGGRNIKGRLLGNPSGSAFTIASGIEPDVAWQPWGDNFLVVYDRSDGDADVFGKLIAAAGGAVGSEIAIAGWPDEERHPRVASCENYQYLVVWQSQCLTPSCDPDVYARFLLGNGAFMPPGDVFGPFEGRWQINESADVACVYGGIDYLVVYQSHLAASTTYAQRIRATGEVSPAAFEPMPPPSDRYDWYPTVAGSRVGWLVAAQRTDEWFYEDDIYVRVAWQLFSDSFEWGNTSAWDFRVP